MATLARQGGSMPPMRRNGPRFTVVHSWSLPFALRRNHNGDALNIRIHAVLIQRDFGKQGICSGRQTAAELDMKGSIVGQAGTTRLYRAALVVKDDIAAFGEAALQHVWL